MNESMTEPVTAIALKERTREYMYRLVELGVVEGPLGAMELPPEIHRILEAVHHVIAGGKAEVAIAEAGDPTVLEELNDRFHNLVEGGWR